MSENCLNCGAALRGPFCHACGQKATAKHLKLHDFVHDAMHEFLHLDGKIWRTLKLLVAKPGMLTLEFIEGRRAQYITPLRLYLTFSVLFFALAALIPGAQESMIRTKAPQTAANPAEAQHQADEMQHAIMTNLPRAMFVLMPAFGALTWLFYRRQQPFYIAHLYYSVHFHAFVFLTLTIAMLLGIMGRPGRLLGGIVFLANFPYHYIALRRVFGCSRPATLTKGTAIGILYWLLIAAAMLVILFVVLKLMGISLTSPRVRTNM